jgi:heme-degrading monooxygenase HmoA
MIWHLAQINIARLLFPIDSPQLAGFVARLDEVNAAAEASPGFVWRLVGDGNDATSLRPFPDPAILVNMSVWESVDALAAFAYRHEGHKETMRGRHGWFEKMEGPHLALWWIKAGTIPTLSDARDRLDSLAQRGASPFAFTFKDRFPPEG